MSNSLSTILHLPQLAWNWLSAAIFLTLADPYMPTSIALNKSGAKARSLH